MTPAALLATLHAQGVRLSAAGERLHLDAPAGVLTLSVRAEVTAHKPALLALLAGAANDSGAGWPEGCREDFEERAAIAEFEGGLSREAAERLALEQIGPLAMAAAHPVVAAFLAVFPGARVVSVGPGDRASADAKAGAP